MSRRRRRTVTLNKPERRNAGPAGWRRSTAGRCTTPIPIRTVRVVVLTGAGKDFCAGAHAEALDSITADGGTYTKAKLPLPPYPESAPEQCAATTWCRC